MDIFIPSKNIGIEYQGRQHFESVEFFGGEEAFKHRVVLDNKKRCICENNGIHLIEWRYDEPISKKYLEKKLHDCGIVMAI